MFGLYIQSAVLPESFFYVPPPLHNLNDFPEEASMKKYLQKLNLIEQQF